MTTRSQKARMRRAYLKHRTTRIDPRFPDLQKEAQARAKHENVFLSSLFGVPLGDIMPPEVNRARLGVKEILEGTPTVNHVTVTNNPSYKLFLFWDFYQEGKGKSKYWFFVEVYPETGMTRRSKRYWTRLQASIDQQEFSITWVSTSRVKDTT